jgi:hypothetical protein
MPGANVLQYVLFLLLVTALVAPAGRFMPCMVSAAETPDAGAHQHRLDRLRQVCPPAREMWIDRCRPPK